MIIIQTNLKKIPESCTKCPYSFCEREFGRDSERFCSVSFTKGMSRPIPYKFVPERKNWCYIKPKWCPLKESEESK